MAARVPAESDLVKGLPYLETVFFLVVSGTFSSEGVERFDGLAVRTAGACL